MIGGIVPFVLVIITGLRSLAGICCQYLVSDLDKQDEDDDNKQVVENADSSNDDVDDLESKTRNEEQIRRNIVIFQPRRCNV